MDQYDLEIQIQKSFVFSSSVKQSIFVNLKHMYAPTRGYNSISMDTVMNNTE